MKKLSFLLIIGVTLILSSCNNANTSKNSKNPDKISNFSYKTIFVAYYLDFVYSFHHNPSDFAYQTGFLSIVTSQY